MPNDRIDALADRFERKSEDRDRQLGEMSSTIAAYERDFIAVDARLVALEKRPGLPAFLGAIVSICALAAALVGFVIQSERAQVESRREILIERETALGHQIEDLKDTTRLNSDRMYSIIQRLSKVESAVATP